MSVQDRGALEAERDFLLDSIRKLDDDREAGVLTDQEYVDLRDEQTVRAARVLEELDQFQTPQESAPRRKFALPVLDKRIYWLMGAGAFVILCIVALGAGLTDRLAGQTTTGSINADSNTLLARAQQQAGSGKVADAVKTYDQVLKQDPKNVQALTYKGWLIRLAGLPNEGLDSINQALAVNPNYPDAHFFKGFILFRDRQDPKSAIPEFQAFLNDNPPQDMVPLVQQTLQDAQAEAATQH